MEGGRKSSPGKKCQDLVMLTGARGLETQRRCVKETEGRMDLAGVMLSEIS